jgi:hypothetical protein
MLVYSLSKKKRLPISIKCRFEFHLFEGSLLVRDEKLASRLASSNNVCPI